MFQGRGILKLAVFGLMAIALGIVVACGGGVSEKEYDAATSQLAAEQQKAATLQQQLTAAQAEAKAVTELKQQVATKEQELSSLQQQHQTHLADAARATELTKQISAKEKEITDLKSQLGKAAGVTTLIGAIPATVAPRATPTPLPAGFTPPPPAPAAKPDAAFLNEVIPFAFYVETLATGSVSKYNFASFPSCVPNSIFKRGTKLVYRFEVIDTSTGKRVSDQEGATVKIRLPHGEELTPRYSKRGGIGPWTWASGWDIPPDYPLGAFDYTITVTTKDGRTGTFDMKKLALIRPATATAAGIDSRVQIVE